MRRIAIRWAPAALWAFFLLFLGSRSPDALPEAPWMFEGVDKVMHFAMYGALGFLWARGRAGVGPARALVEGAIVGALWGGLDEWIQSFVGRDPDRFDVLADVLGAAVGGWLGGRTLARRQRS